MTHKNDGKGISTVAAGVFGATVGVVVGAAAAVLSDEKNRKAIGKKFTEVKNNAMDMTTKAVDQGKKKVEEAKKAVKSKL